MSLRRVTLKAGADLEGFRAAVRALVAEEMAPQHVIWVIADAPDLFGAEAVGAAPPVALPRAVSNLVALVVCHQDPERYALLYQLVWRVLNGERSLMEIASDPLVHRLALLAKSVRRDLHKMHAFLRFRRVEAGGGEPSAEASGARERYVAWFEPDHFILEAAAPFFVDRFRALVWSILTPVGSAHWDGERLVIGPAGRREDAPGEDAFEEAWLGYYESTFNPARVNPGVMRAEMPKKYWRNLPEAAAIPRLIQEAPQRVAEMIEREAKGSAKRDPARAVAAMADQAPRTLQELNEIIRRSEPLVPGATGAVLGEGPVGAAIAFVGEQPGDQEDRQGRPFVGPAGQLLMRALAEAGIEREEAYLTNAVKHFKFEQRGERRIHQTPTAGEVKHYRWWLERELELVRPRLVVALGATAVLALTGRAVSVTRARGPAEFADRFPGYVTVHPSYLLRLPDEEARRAATRAFVDDLRQVRAIALEAGGRGTLRQAAE